MSTGTLFDPGGFSAVHEVMALDTRGYWGLLLLLQYYVVRESLQLHG